MAERARLRRTADQAEQGSLRRILEPLRRRSADERRSIAGEKRWALGAEGEEMLAASLAKRCPDLPLLHDRRMPQSRANIDHLAFAPSGVYVIDTKRYQGRIRVSKPLIGRAKLLIAGRDRTKLIEGLARQVAAVQSVVAELGPEVPVHGCLCFVLPKGLLAEGGLPLLRRLSIDGYRLFYPRGLARQLRKAGPIDPAHARELKAEVAKRLPPA